MSVGKRVELGLTFVLYCHCPNSTTLIFEPLTMFCWKDRTVIYGFVDIRCNIIYVLWS